MIPTKKPLRLWRNKMSKYLVEIEAQETNPEIFEANLRFLLASFASLQEISILKVVPQPKPKGQTNETDT